LLFQTSLFSDLGKTNGSYNGNHWTGLDDTSQLYFVVGFDKASVRFITIYIYK